MDFTLSEDQTALRGLAAEIIGERATSARVEEVEAGNERIDRELWAELTAAGLVGVAVPEDLGGLGLGLVELCLVAEEVGRHVAPVPFTWVASAALAVWGLGTTAQRERWLPAVAAGEVLLTSALPPSTVGVTVEDDHLTGTLIGVAAAHVADAIVVPVSGRLYVVDLTAPGVDLRLGEATDRQRHAEVRLAGAPAEPLGGEGGATWLWQRTAVLLAAVQAGVTAGALRMAADYTSSRLQFDKPLSSFQGVSFRAADGYISNSAIRATMLQAAWRLDRGDDAAAEVLTAAWWAAEAGQDCVHAVQHIHGGIGADVTYPVHRFFLWGKQIELMLGGASALLAELGDVLATMEAPGDELVLSL